MLTLIGCQTLPRAPVVPMPELVTGRLSVTGITVNPSFQFKQLAGDSQQLSLSGAFGIGRFTLFFSNDGTFFGEKDGVALDAGELQQSLTELTGLQLPLSVLPYWLTARPYDGAPFNELADGFIQLGWRLQVIRPAIEAPPTRIVVTKDALTIVLGIRSWR